MGEKNPDRWVPLLDGRFAMQAELSDDTYFRAAGFDTSCEAEEAVARALEEGAATVRLFDDETLVLEATGPRKRQIWLPPLPEEARPIYNHLHSCMARGMPFAEIKAAVERIGHEERRNRIMDRHYEEKSPDTQPSPGTER